MRRELAKEGNRVGVSSSRGLYSRPDRRAAAHGRCAVSHPAIIGPDERLIGSPLATFLLGVPASDEFVWTSGFSYNRVGTFIVLREARPLLVHNGASCGRARTA